jgi:glyoxylase-like metal-dependent hydrolase (beta-lactamase superfamily II)
MKASKINDKILVVTGDFLEEHLTVIDSGEGLIAIDTLTTPSSTKKAIELIRTYFDQPFKYLINTHSDIDHCGGNQLFENIPIIAHENYRNHKDTPIFCKNENEEKFKNIVNSLKQRQSGLKGT